MLRYCNWLIGSVNDKEIKYEWNVESICSEQMLLIRICYCWRRPRHESSGIKTVVQRGSHEYLEIARAGAELNWVE